MAGKIPLVAAPSAACFINIHHTDRSTVPPDTLRTIPGCVTRSAPGPGAHPALNEAPGDTPDRIGRQFNPRPDRKQAARSRLIP